ncbi:MAG: M56 family metallopeptidase [Balneolaceae bacterium]|nr:M56 family metallopeptidase [Balneolaceae bacterium]
MESFITQIASYTEQVLIFAWFPILIWTAATGIIWLILKLSVNLHPQYHYHGRLAILISLPAGLIFLAALQRAGNVLLPDSSAGSMAIVSFPSPLDFSSGAIFPEAEAISLSSTEILLSTIASVFLIGFLLLFARFLTQWLQLQRLKRTVSLIPIKKYGMINFSNQKLATDHKKQIHIAFLDKPVVPVTFGFRRPVILLPSALRTDEEKCNMAIRHELIHIRQKDFITHAAVLVTQMLFWFHPLVHLLKKEITDYREIRCDSLVLSDQDVSKKKYASLLLELLPLPSVNNELSVNMAQESSNLKKRIEMITQNKDQIKPAPKRSSIGLSSAVILCTSLAMTFTEIQSDTVFHLNGPIVLENVLGTVTDNEGYHEVTLFMADPSDFEKNTEKLRQKGNALDENKIYSVHVYKDEKAIEKFGEPGRHGVIVIKTTQSEESYQEKLKELKLEGHGSDLNRPQNHSPSQQYDDDIQKPRLADGGRSMQTNIRYPRKAREAGIEGLVVATFVVTEEGNVENPEIAETPGESLGEEVLRNLDKLKFEPALKNGNPVRAEFELPVNFKLMSMTQDEDTSEHIPEGGFAVIGYGGQGDENRRTWW